MKIQAINKKKIAASSWRLALVVGPIMCLMICKFQPCESIFNCFTPNMFNKMGKVGQPGAYPGSNPGERAHWYPQAQQQLPYAMAYGQRPMSRLFQPKWRSPLFGPKRWMDWRMNAANMNFYRPGYGYWPPTGQMPPSSPPILTPISGNPASNYNQLFSEQLNLPPYSSSNSPQLPASNPYGSQSGSSQLATSNNNNINDGWSLPYVSPYNRPSLQQQPYGDSYSVLPGTQNLPTKQQQDSNNYGTKGASGSNKQQQQYGTTKNILLADGGYNSVDAHLMNQNYPKNYSSTGFGYSYPEWYSGVVESPAKIAQQLYRIQQRRAMLGLKV